MIHQPAQRPVLVVVDDSPDDVRSLAAELERRYASDYEVVAQASASDALSTLRRLRSEGREVPLIVADMWMDEMTGVELLAQSRQLYPEAKRTVIWSYGDMRALEPMYRAMALGGVDDYLTRPWIPTEHGLYRPVGELLGDWTRANRPRFEAIRMVGEETSARCHEIIDRLAPFNLTIGFHFVDSEAGRRLLEVAGIGAERLPVLLMHDGRVLVDPTDVEIATALGGRTRAREGIWPHSEIAARR
jgi:thioredoxin reductase (NADPH)